MKRRWYASAMALLALSGCSLLLGPERAEIRPAMDGGAMDAPDALDAAVDAPEVVIDAGCIPSETRERSCDDGVDNDCDGLTDCDDFACRPSGYCCEAEDGSPWDISDRNFLSWSSVGPSEGGPESISDTTITFGSQSSVLFPTCAPLAYGARLSASFNVTGESADYAGITLTRVSQVPTDGSRLADELSVRVFANGRITIEQAGRELAYAELPGNGVRDIDLTMTPGFDEGGVGILRITLSATRGTDTERVAIAQPYLLLDDLLGANAAGGGCRPDGLFIAVEGRGYDVKPVTPSGANAPVSLELFSCENPRSFTPDTVVPSQVADQLVEGSWRVGGVGEPTMQNFVIGGANRLELWVDGAAQERDDELWSPVTFAVGGTFQQDADPWTPRERSGSPELVAEAREPTLLAPVDDFGAIGSSDLWLAYAQERPGTDVYEIVLTQASTNSSTTVETEPWFTFRPPEECLSVRDPSLAALTREPNSDLLLFFTCERDGLELDGIGVARLSLDLANSRLEQVAVDPSLLLPTGGEDDARGVFSPEAIVTGEEVRVWYLARASDGELRLALALGRRPRDGDEEAPQLLPEVFPYAGNPLLDGRSPALGTEDCTLGCSIKAFSVATTTDSGAVPHWTESVFIFLLERTRQTESGPVHELIPLTQARPSDE